ncbi:tRNA dimethylallyltransferase [Kribbella sp. VKM Ac-2569]|uniref:tRNA (adenosine(37)-N6)-dimethylallyltransferase n=1 Tax=Kribbella sp. VKM Ac-2569 TaxID=2512220 RepID=UPI00102BB965|nr:isopentenyl transferase family protein [Kribbella sp. VKM Ac-2569]RZT20448.1 tRNA dimethylallyltransferase [Kribbella sp. VKM Ac-2569]
MPDAPPRLLVALYGPTSAGKTAVSVDLCLRIRDELGLPPMVVSADSRQVYRSMDIGTSKTTPEEMRGVPHTMIDVTEPLRKLELETFVAEARRHMEDCWASGGVPVIVGGTSVYVRSLLEGWEVDAVAESRNAVRRDFPRSMAEDAYAVLTRLDPKAAGKIHENNYDAIVNALARAMGNDPERAVTPAARQVVLSVDRPAAEIDQRVAATYDRQVELGLRDEVLGLDERYDVLTHYRRLGQKSPNQVVHTHGYTEWFDVALDRGKPVENLTGTDLDEVRTRVVERIQTHTRRQRSAIPKLTGVRSVRNASDAFTQVKKALEAAPEPAAGPRSIASKPHRSAKSSRRRGSLR